MQTGPEHIGLRLDDSACRVVATLDEQMRSLAKAESIQKVKGTLTRRQRSKPGK